MRPKTIEDVLLEFGDEELISLGQTDKAVSMILGLVSQAIQENRHGFGLTVAEGEQLARRVKVALL